MSFFKKINAKFGNGSVAVNLVLDKSEYRRGDEVRGVIKLTGGSVSQKVDGIFIELSTEKNHVTEMYGDYKVHNDFEIGTNETKEINFSIVLPENGPFTTEQQMVQLVTRVAIAFAVDARDQDYIKVKE